MEAIKMILKMTWFSSLDQKRFYVDHYENNINTIMKTTETITQRLTYNEIMSYKKHIRNNYKRKVVIHSYRNM